MEKIKAGLPTKEDVIQNGLIGGMIIVLLAMLFTGGLGTVISIVAFMLIIIMSQLL